MISSFQGARMATLLVSAALLFGTSEGCKDPPPPAPAPSASIAAPQPSAAPPVKEADTAIVIGERQTFHSSILGEDRTILVHTPASYKKGKAAYPVLYLLDGDENFHHTTGITAFLSERGRAPEMIVIGVASTADGRERDLTPTVLKDHPGGGGAGKFLSFLKDELRPHVEGAYRTQPFRILVGHSHGALFALHALTTAPDTFNAYIAMSPSLPWDDETLLHGAEKAFASHPDLQAFLYLTTGNEGGKMLEDVTSFAAILKARAPKGLEWSFKHMDQETHMSLPHRSTYDGLELLFKGWEAPAEIATAKALEAHYEGLSKKLHFEVKLTEELLNNFAFNNYMKHHDEAMAAFKLSVELHPDSAGAYYLLGQAYGDAGQTDLAKANLEIAVRKATETSDPALAEMKEKLARVSQPKAK
ncbi:MAG: alpha/beta hydrolase-fold protein [Byssovorax sp.]